MATAGAMMAAYIRRQASPKNMAKVAAGDKHPPYLFLTNWNYWLVVGVTGAVGVAALHDGVFTASRPYLALGTTAVATTSLFVLIARMALLRMKVTPWDVLSHGIAPCVPAVLLGTGALAAARGHAYLGAGTGILLLAVWLAVNAAVQHRCPRQSWPYKSAVNPRTPSGRLQIVGATILALACAGAAVGIHTLAAAPARGPVAFASTKP